MPGLLYNLKPSRKIELNNNKSFHITYILRCSDKYTLNRKPGLADKLIEKKFQSLISGMSGEHDKTNAVRKLKAL